MAEGLDFETLFKPDGLFHGGRPRRLCEFDLLAIFLIEKMEVLRFVPGTHIKIFVHVQVLLPQLQPILLGEVGDLPGVDLEVFLHDWQLLGGLGGYGGTSSMRSTSSVSSSRERSMSSVFFWGWSWEWKDLRMRLILVRVFMFGIDLINGTQINYSAFEVYFLGEMG